MNTTTSKGFHLRVRQILLSYISTLVFSFASILLFSSLALCATKVFEREYTYKASEIDSKVTCRAIALELVKRSLLEELGTYLESKTVIKNMDMTTDQITTLSAGVVSTEIIKEKWDGETYWLKARIEADANEVAGSLEKLRADVGKSEALERSRKEAEDAIKEAERLRMELEKLKAEKTSIKKASIITKEYNKAINNMSAVDWYEKGHALNRNNKYNESINAFEKAIELKPDYTDAYSMRGFILASLGNFDKAIADFNYTIEIRLKNAKVQKRGGMYDMLPPDTFERNNSLLAVDFLGRGYAYFYNGNHNLALNDLTRSIELNQENTLPYELRGKVYLHFKNHENALQDLNMAISLKPSDSSPFYLKGRVYLDLKQYEVAIKYFDKAISLKYNDSRIYYFRGFALLELNRYEHAINDYTRVITFQPDSQLKALAYSDRGTAYLMLKNEEYACNDFEIACELASCKRFKMAIQGGICK